MLGNTSTGLSAGPAPPDKQIIGVPLKDGIVGGVVGRLCNLFPVIVP